MSRKLPRIRDFGYTRKPIYKFDRPSTIEPSTYIAREARPPSLNRVKDCPPFITVGYTAPIDHTKHKLALEPQRLTSINSVGPVWSGKFNLPKYPGRQNRGMHSFLEVISTPTADTPGTALVLHFDHKRYLIGNCAEGTQRAAVQRGTKLMKLSDILLTGPVTWTNTGGLLGMILTIADATATQAVAADQERKRKQDKKAKRVAVEESRHEKKIREQAALTAGEIKAWLNVHGGKNLTHTMATARRFVFRQGMPVHLQEFRAAAMKQQRELQEAAEEDMGKPTWEDQTIKVWAMVLEPEVEPTRKRSHEEYREDIQSTEGKEKAGTAAEQEDMDDQLRKGVVAQMFGSTWRLDALESTKLSEVRMPAQIFVRNDGRIEKYEGPTIEEGGPDIEVLMRKPWPGALIETLPAATPCKDSICYIIKGYPQRGKFDPVAAKALGVIPKQFAPLTKGESIVTGDGKTVTGDMVMGATREGGGFAVVELPDPSYVSALLGRKEWLTSEIMNGVGAIFWIIGPGVLEDPRVEAFMKNHSELNHIVSSTDVCANNLALESPAAAAIRLNFIDPDRFTIPAHNNLAPITPTNSSLYQVARPGKKLVLQPSLRVKDDEIVQFLDINAVNQEAMDDKDIQDLAVQAQTEIRSPEYVKNLAKIQDDIPSKDAEVIALGTGSSMPSKYRNVSGTLVRVPGYGTYLFDAGENTLGQMKRVFGKQFIEVIRDLKAIWISHLHADHHLGTVPVIRAWHEATKDDPKTADTKLLVASDVAMLDFLEEYSGVEDFGLSRVELLSMGSTATPNQTTNSEHKRFSGRYFHNFPRNSPTGLTKISTCHVQHCNQAMAVAFEFANGFKVAFSGDCRPSDRFVEIGKGATLLIHEATFDDEMKGDAIAKKHSTTGEALDVGRRMGARRILLTHFSQRYQKIPVMQTNDDQVAIVAFDYMRTKIGDFALVEKFKPALIKLYEDSDGN